MLWLSFHMDEGKTLPKNFFLLCGKVTMITHFLLRQNKWQICSDDYIDCEDNVPHEFLNVKSGTANVLPLLTLISCELRLETFPRSFSLLNLEQNTSYSFLMTCSDRQDNFWSSEKINFDTGSTLSYVIKVTWIICLLHPSSPFDHFKEVYEAITTTCS